MGCVLTQTCVPPGDDACLEAECEENLIVTGKHWCALTQTCFEQGDQSCDKAYCELESESTGFKWCELTGTCVAPGDDACLEAECEENSVSTGYHWCALTQICFPPGDRECDKAYCELESESTGFSSCVSESVCREKRKGRKEGRKMATTAASKTTEEDVRKKANYTTVYSFDTDIPCKSRTSHTIHSICLFLSLSPINLSVTVTSKFI